MRGGSVLRVGLGLLLAVVVIGALLWSAQRRLIYFPDRTAVPPAASVLPGASDITLETSDGLRLGAWLVPPTAADRRIAVLVAPGNGGNRVGRAPLARALSGLGLTVLLLDYRGYGGNPGDPDAAGLGRDVRAGLRLLTGDAGFPPERIIYFGESLGCAVVAELAATEPPGGLLLRSPFADLAAVGRHHYPILPLGLLLRDRYPVADLIAGLDVPSVVVYGTADGVVPAAQSRAVAERAVDLVAVVPVDGADHNDRVLLDGAPIVDAVRALADRLG